MDGIHNGVLSQPRSDMDRVSKTDPCPICKRADWCLVAPDKSAAICMRHAEGSVREIECGGGIGYLHILSESVGVSSYTHPSYAPKPSIDWTKRSADAFMGANANRAHSPTYAARALTSTAHVQPKC